MSTSRTPQYLAAAIAARLDFEDACRQAGRRPETTITGPGGTGAAEAAHAAFVTYTHSAGVSPHRTEEENAAIREHCREEVRNGVLRARAERVIAARATGTPVLAVQRVTGDLRSIEPYYQVRSRSAAATMSLHELVMAAEQADPDLGRGYALALRDALALEVQ